MAKGISVAYDALPSISDFESVRADVERQLPLRNLHWVRKSSATRTIRTIQALPLNLRPLEAYGEAPSKPDLIERPYLYLLFVVCDDNEVYRATLRTQIREWLDSITSKQHQEWLIVHVTTGRSGVAKFYQRKGAIVDKIKADFNVGKKDRCIQVAQGASADDPTAWAEFLTKVKEGVVATFDSNVGLYEENVRKADSQRQLEGWQFLPFFRQKEALAESFEVTTLFEDALIQYDELEASFFQNLKEHNNALWFRNVGASTPGDDALPILSTTAKPYRQLIESNSINVFDFRVYLFARQATMLFKLGRVVEVARRGAYFVSTFARTLREHHASLGTNFVESWTYSACLSIADECERRISEDLEAGETNFLAVKAELLELAKKQLDKIGMSAGHLPALHPFSMSLNEVSSPAPLPSSVSSVRSLVTRRDLLDAIASVETFDALYIDLSRRTIQAYQSSGRRRSAVKLHSFLAALEHHRSNLEAAQKLYSQLPAHYTDTKWTSIESYLLSRSTRLQTSLEMPRDRLLSTLALVRAGMDIGTERWALDAVVDSSDVSEVESAGLAARLMGDVYELSSGLSKDFAAVAFPTFSIRLLAGSGSRAPDEDGITATVIVRNFLPCPLRVDEVRLKLVTADNEQIWLTAGACDLQPGDTQVTVLCPTAATGLLLLELSQLRFSRIIFQYSHRPVTSRSSPPPSRSSAVSDGQPSLLVHRDYQAVHLYVEDPDSVDLDRDREAIICIDSGRNSVTKLTLRFPFEDPNVNFATSSMKLVQGGCRINTDESGAIVLEGISPYEIVKIRLPLTGNLADSTIQFTASAEYMTTKRPQTRRQLRRSFSFSIALPLAVNVQDYFREQCLLSKFSITTDGVQGVKVQSACIEAPSTVTVQPCRAASDSPVLISPLQTANFLFKILCDDPSSVVEPLRLVLTYSSVENQLRTHARALVLASFDGTTLAPHRRWVTTAFVADAVTATDLDDYSLDVRLGTLVFRPETWRKRAERCLEKVELRAKVLEAVERLYERAQLDDSKPAVQWRTLAIPLDLPSLHVLSLVRVEPAVSRAEVGQAVPSTLTIRSSFRWRRGTASVGPIRLAYSVLANASDRIISGRARGEFTAEDDSDFTVPLTFVPLSPSALFLPSVAITPLSSSAQNEFLTCETQHVTAATFVEILPITHRTTYDIAVPVAG